MLVGLAGTVVVVPPVQDYTHQTVLPRWLRVLYCLEPKLVVNVLHEQDVVQEVVLYLYFAQLVHISVTE